jgi:hypothetical protein
VWSLAYGSLKQTMNHFENTARPGDFLYYYSEVSPLTRVTRYPISIRRMTISILSSPISISHIDIGSYLVTLPLTRSTYPS